MTLHSALYKLFRVVQHTQPIEARRAKRCPLSAAAAGAVIFSSTQPRAAHLVAALHAISLSRPIAHSIPSFRPACCRTPLASFRRSHHFVALLFTSLDFLPSSNCHQCCGSWRLTLPGRYLVSGVTTAGRAITLSGRSQPSTVSCQWAICHTGSIAISSV